MKRMKWALAGLAVAALAGIGSSSAEARRSHYAFGFSSGPVGIPAPVYYAPRPVVYPAYGYYPSYVAPAPVYPVYGAPACGGSSFSFSFWR